MIEGTRDITFQGSTIRTLIIGKTVFVSLRQLCDEFGLIYGYQYDKVARSPGKYESIEVEGYFKNEEESSLLVPISNLTYWFNSIRITRLSEENRLKALAFKERLIPTVEEAWSDKDKLLETDNDHRAILRSVIDDMVKKNPETGYPDFWRLIHDRFDVSRCNQLTVNETKEATSYIKIIASELVSQKKTSVYSKYELSNDELRSLCWLWNIATIMIDRIAEVEPLLRAAEHSLRGAFWSMAHEYPRTANESKKILQRITSHIDTNRGRDWKVLDKLRMSKG
jgi:hypothetical protein